MARLFSLLTSVALLATIDAFGAPGVAMAAPVSDSLDTVSDDTTADHKREDHLRIFGGGASFIGFGAPNEYFPLLNLGYCWAWSASSGSASVVPAGEIGVNFLFPSLPLPYLKVGPELRVGRFRVAGHAGFMMTTNPLNGYGFSITMPDSDDRSLALAAIPFAGLSANYGMMMQSVGIDLEGGVNFPNLSRFGAIPYVMAGVAFR